MSHRLLIIDDEDNMRHMLQAMLSRSGYDITQAINGLDALEKVRRERFNFILCDVRMPAMSGMEFLEEARQHLTESTVIMMSAYGTVDLAIEAMKKGAYDYISKPFKSDEVLLALKKAEEREALKKENVRLRKELSNFYTETSFHGMIGESESMQEIIRKAEKVAAYNTTVLITGESGTGKEVLARAIHRASPRAVKKFYAVNCASIPTHLLESELFGHTKGSFTGAGQDRKGLFVEANGSTLFLDEIGDIPKDMQVKLLRVLQEGEVKPVGANAVERVDVRILAATSKDLESDIKTGLFREDLYYRLNIVRLEIPPLRERKRDIIPLSRYFFQRMKVKIGGEAEDFTKQALRKLMHYAWPGNVRELENVIERAAVFADRKQIGPEDLPEAIQLIDEPENQASTNLNFSIKDATADIEASLIRKALRYTDGNKSRAAELLELSYPSLLSKIKKYRLA